MDADDDLCICDQPQICTCVFELDWMKDLLDPIEDEGYESGFQDGIEFGIRDTIYSNPISLETDGPGILPFIASIDPCRYQRAYSDGYADGYHQTYRRHVLVIEELKLLHLRQAYYIYLISRFGSHPLLDFCLFQKIDFYLPLQKSKK